MKLLTNIFSIINIDKKHKMITLLGLKIKIKRKQKDKGQLSAANMRKLVAYVEQIKFILDSCCDITQCKPATGTFRKVQMFRAKVLKYLLELFQENGIQYWIDGGSLLGAQRHKGFVPWDDDIDIATDRDNYDKMLELLPKLFENTGLSMDFGRGHTGFYMKIYYNDFDITDVFVYDYSNNDCSREHLYELWTNSRVDFYQTYPPKQLWSGELDIKNLYSKLKDYYRKGNLTLEEGIENKWLFKGFDAATKNLTCNIFAVDKVFPLQKVQFEDMEVYAPKDIHNYLTTVNSGNYGDYMQFPPLSSSHVFLSNEYDSDEFLETLNKNIESFDKLLEQKLGQPV